MCLFCNFWLEILNNSMLITLAFECKDEGFTNKTMKMCTNQLTRKVDSLLLCKSIEFIAFVTK